jgi:hypothetical protein
VQRVSLPFKGQGEAAIATTVVFAQKREKFLLSALGAVISVRDHGRRRCDRYDRMARHRQGDGDEADMHMGTVRLLRGLVDCCLLAGLAGGDFRARSPTPAGNDAPGR